MAISLGTRRLRIAAGAFVAAALLVAALLHTPPVRTRALGLLVSRLADAGFVAHADALDYNLLTLTAHLSGVTLAVPSAAATPFFAAREVRLTLPWRALGGRLGIDRLEIQSPRVTLRRDASGRDNWTPGRRGPASTAPVALHVGRAIVTDGAIDWTDDTAAAHADAAFGFDLMPRDKATTGPIAMARPIRVDWRGRVTSIVVADGRLAWNDRDLIVSGLSLRAPEGTVKIDGRVDGLLGAPRLDARAAIDGNLAAMSSWLDARRPIAGTAHIAAHVDDAGIELTNLRADLAGGAVVGQGRVGFDGGGQARVNWTRLDLREIVDRALGEPAPVRLSSRSGGSLDARWTAPRLDALQVTANARLVGQARSDRRPAVPVDAALALALDGARWRLTAARIDALGARATATLDGALDAADLRRSTIAGTIRAETAGDREWPRALVRAGLLRADPQVHGSIGTALTVGGTFGAPSLDGDVEATLQYQSLPPARVRGRASIVPSAIRLDTIDARMAGSRAGGAIRWATGSDAIAGTLDGTLQLRDVAAVAPSLPASLALDGSVALSAALSGTLATPLAAIRASGRALEVSGQRLDRVEATARLAGAELTLDGLGAVVENGRLDAAGTVDFARGTYTATLRATALPIHPTLAIDGVREAPLSGRLQGRLDGAGSLQALTGGGRLWFTEARWRDADLGRIGGDVALAGGTATFTVEAPDVALNARGTVGLDAAGAVALSATWEPADVAAVVRRLGVDAPVAGSAAIDLTWNGALGEVDNGRASIGVSRADLAVAGQPFRLTRAGRIDLDPVAIRTTPIVLSTGTSTVTLDGALGGAGSSGPLAVTVDGSVADFAFVRDLVQPRAEGAPAPTTPTGSLNARLIATGTRAAPTVSGTLRVDGGAMPVNDSAQVTGVEVRARYDAGVLTVERANAAFQEAALAATARVPSGLFADRVPAALRPWIAIAPGPATLSATVRSITPSVAAPFVDAATLDEIALHADASIDLRADRPELNAVRGTIVLDRAELSLSGVAFDQETATRLSVADGRLTVDTWRWGRGENRLALRGGLTLAADPAIDLTAAAALDLRLVNAFAPSARTSGRADAEVRVAGTASAPSVDGFVTVSGGETRLADPRLIVGDIAGTITLAGDTLTLHRMSATVNGGDAELAGSIRHRGLAPLDGSVTLAMKGSALDVSGARAEADAALTWTLDDSGSAIGGTVTLLRGAYREPVVLTSRLLAALRGSSALPAATGSAEPSLLDRTRLDVRLVTDDDLIVDNNVARLTLHGDLRAVGTVARPSITGRAELGEGGVVFFNGTRYRLTDRRSIEFANPARIEPDLDLTAVARAQGEEITVTLTGTPATLSAKLDSENKTLTQSDLVSLLLVGRRASDAGDAMAGTEDLVGLVTGNFLEAAGRAIGFDTARIERGTPDFRFDAGLVAAETDPGARLTFGKAIGSRFDLVFSQSLQQSGGLTWIVGYKPRSGIDLRAVSLDEGDRVYTFSHDLTFGGAARRAAAAPKPVPRVSAIDIGGAAGDERDLRSRLRLQPHDRFSFFEWQDDRERLERAYHDRGRLEARIAARRMTDPADATRVRLVYEVRPGPRTALVVEGGSLSKSAAAAAERAWQRSVADDFLIDEVADLVRADLGDRGYLQPSVTARMETASGEKRLRVAIAPGERVGRRRVEVSGNTSQSSERLLTHLAQRGLTRAVWTDPDAVRDELTAFYRADGYLRATVTVGPIAIAPGVASRPIAIVEGEPFRVGTIAIEGVRALAAEDAAQVVGIAAGDRYSEARLARAQLALDAQYRARGFNRVGIDSQAHAADAASTVAIVLRVDEGPQQRLREVVTTGLARTKPELLSRALRLTVGEPVDLSAWNAARRRLYETGAFRSVDIEREVLEPVVATPEAAAAVEEPVRATVTVQEWPPLRLRYGVEVRDELQAAGDAARANAPDTERSGGRTFGLGVAGDLSARGLFGRAISAGVAGRYTLNARASRAYATAPSFFGLPITSTVFVERAREELGAAPGSNLPVFEAITTDLTLEQRVRLSPRTAVSYLYTRERNHTRRLDPDPLDPLPFDVTVTTGRFGTAILFDRRDDPLDAARGWFHSSSLSYAPAALGSDLRFLKYFVQQLYYRRVGPVVVASAGRLGLATAFDLTLTPSERFFAGGGNSVRGYAEDVLSPLDPLGGAVGGNALVVLNQEVRFPVYGMVRGVGFFDAGRAFDRVGDISLRALGASAGLGLRVATPFALVRVDMGVPFDTGFGPRRARWFFSIGQMF